MATGSLTLDAHEELVRLAERRVRRARQKREALEAEEADAKRKLEQARQDRTDWIASNPDPQMMML